MILIVDDHAFLRAILRDWLSRALSGYVFGEASDGEEAVRLALARAPALVVMDLGLPKLNGIEATRLIKQSLPETHIVIISVHEARPFCDAATAAGASAYIPKRTLAADLTPTVKALLG
jgi:two-component system response regulator NreC